MNQPEDRAQAIEAMIEAEVARAVAPYRSMGLPREILAEMESLLRLGLRTHPTAQRLLRQLLPDPDIKRSDQISLRGFEAADDPWEGKA